MLEWQAIVWIKCLETGALNPLAGFLRIFTVALIGYVRIVSGF